MSVFTVEVEAAYGYDDDSLAVYVDGKEVMRHCIVADACEERKDLVRALDAIVEAERKR